MYNIVTIARTLGSRGEDVGRIVAEQCGYRYADDEIIVAAAERAGVSPETIERAEHRPGLIARILDSMAGVPLEPQVYYGQALATAIPAEAPAGYDELIRDVIIETANRGNVVIVAHGAGICLAGAPGALRVLVTASPSARASRVAEATGADDQRARKAVQDSDGQRQDFLRRFYDVKQEAPTHYDLVINTDAVTPDAAARIVIDAARG